MERSILSKGKTVNDAVEMALNTLNAKYEDVDIQIIANESKGLMGLLSKPAIVRVTAREVTDLIPKLGGTNSSASPHTNAIVVALEEDLKKLERGIKHTPYKESNKGAPKSDDLLGKAWVQGGTLYCKDAPNKYPMVIVGDQIQLFKNDELVQSAVSIREDDKLRIDLQDDIQEPKWELLLSDNNMEAKLKVIPGMRILRSLKDKSPGVQIRLEIQEKKEPVIIDAGQIMDKLKELGIVAGIDFNEIARACTSEEAGSFVIAKGTPPIPGKNGYFTLIKDVDVKKGFIEKEDGTVDYRETSQFPSVEEGQVIGVVNQPVPGKDGQSLINEPVPPPQVQPIEIRVGRGAIQAEDGAKVVASEAGHPEIRIKGLVATISVVPKLMINKDVDLHTGNVHFTGDVEVSGNVQEGMLVDAQGNVQVNENVHSARIVCGKSVIVRRNVISSEINAGQGNILKAELIQMLELLITQLNQLVSAITQLSTISAFNVSANTHTGLGPLIKILCDGKFKPTRTLIHDLIKKVMSGTKVLDRDWIVLCDQLNKGFIISHSSSLQTIDDLHQFIQECSELQITQTESDREQKAYIHAGFIHNSQLYSSGDIIIIGKGSYNSKLHAEGVVEIEGSVRGGEIYGARGVKLGEAGSKGGNMTKIRVSNDATIRMNRAMQDTVIQIGIKTYKFMVETTEVVARLDSDDNIIIS